ncbi:MAG: FKBP-type peptidyl-prolyl cis-trans isomerase [Bacteroidales bacterium]
MKKMSMFFAGVALAAMGVNTASCDSLTSAKMSSDVDSASYAIGVINGSNFRENLETAPGDPLNIDALIAGFVTAIKGDTAGLKMTAENAQTYVQSYFTTAQIKEGEKTKAEGEKFLAENKTKSGIITTESGLQYQVITEGTGAKPTPTDTVKVHYTGMLLDGTVFDSSVERGTPAVMALNHTVKGWIEGLQIMPTGSKYIFWLPAELGYGAQGAGNKIKPNSVLKFEIELLEVKKAKV